MEKYYELLTNDVKERLGRKRKCYHIEGGLMVLKIDKEEYVTIDSDGLFKQYIRDNLRHSFNVDDKLRESVQLIISQIEDERIINQTRIVDTYTQDFMRRAMYWKKTIKAIVEKQYKVIGDSVIVKQNEIVTLFFKSDNMVTVTSSKDMYKRPVPDEINDLIRPILSKRVFLTFNVDGYPITGSIIEENEEKKVYVEPNGRKFSVDKNGISRHEGWESL